MYAHSQGESEQKPTKNFGKSSRVHSQGVQKIFMAPIYGAHCAVIFATAQLSCIISCRYIPLLRKFMLMMVGRVGDKCNTADGDICNSEPLPTRGSEPPSHQLGGLGERCKLPQRGPGRRPRKLDIWCNLRPHNCCGNALYK